MFTFLISKTNITMHYIRKYLYINPQPLQIFKETNVVCCIPTESNTGL